MHLYYFRESLPLYEDTNFNVKVKNVCIIIVSYVHFLVETKKWFPELLCILVLHSKGVTMARLCRLLISEPEFEFYMHFYFSLLL